MKQSIRDKLEHLTGRLDELDRELAAEDSARDMNAFRDLSRERAEIEPVVVLYLAFRQAETDCETARELLDDPEMRELGQLELESGAARIAEL
ncbi:MAG: peptide chain release factor 1, partial [Betaproteobacteria bacterium HGW-Betaproteobacteria-21]